MGNNVGLVDKRSEDQKTVERDMGIQIATSGAIITVFDIGKFDGGEFVPFADLNLKSFTVELPELTKDKGIAMRFQRGKFVMRTEACNIEGVTLLGIKKN